MAQFSLKRLMTAIALVAAACGMLSLLSRTAFKVSAMNTLGYWIRFHAELSFCLWIGSAIAVGSAVAITSKNSKLGVVAALLVFASVAIWLNSSP